MIQRTFTYNYHKKHIDYSVWFTSDVKELDTVVFLGTVQIDKIPKWVAEACPPRTAIVQGAPHWHAKDDGSDTNEYMLGYSKSAMQTLATQYVFESLNIIAESQTVPGSIQLFLTDTYRTRLNRAVFLQPLGFNVATFAGTDEERLSVFKNRIIKNAYYQLTSLLLDGRLRYNHRLLGKTVSFRDPKAKAQYSSGLTYNALPELKQILLQGTEVTIICGEKDKLFPAEEIRKSLKDTDISLSVLEIKDVPHSPLATNHGMKLLRSALAILKS